MVRRGVSTAIVEMQAVAAAKHGAKEQGRKKVGKADNIKKVGKEVGKKVGKNIKAPGYKTTLELQKPVSEVSVQCPPSARLPRRR